MNADTQGALSVKNEVVALDIIPEKVDMINNRISPIQDKEIAVCLGNFDGIHKGHQKLIKKTVEVAKNNNFYLSTYNNTAMIQTGHSNCQATSDEQKIIANTIFFMYYKHVLKESGDEL